MISTVSAYMLVNCEIGQEDAVIKELRKIRDVKESYVLFGLYDCLLKLETDSMNKLKEIVTYKIKPVENVRGIAMMIVIE